MPSSSAALLLIEDLGDQSHACLDVQLATVGGADAGAFLPTMLQGVDAVERLDRDIDLGRPDAEDAARFSGAVVNLA